MQHSNNQKLSEFTHLHGLSVHVKSVDDQTGIAELIVSCFNNVDRANEVIPYGAFTKSLARKLPKGVWMHDWSQPIAKTLEARELQPHDPMLTPQNAMLGGLYVRGQFNLDTQRGREAYSDVKKGIIDEFSIGYQVVKSSTRDDGALSLDEIDLFEWSPVLVGCNPSTSVVSIKTMKQPTLGEAKALDISTLAHFKGAYLGTNIEKSVTTGALSDLGYSLQWAFYTIIYGSGTTEEKIQAIGEACDEFKQISLKVSAAVLAVDATTEEVEKAFAGICTKAFGPQGIKVGATFSAANKKALNDKVKAFNAMAKSLKAHAKDIEDMVADKDDADAESEKDDEDMTEKSAEATLETKSEESDALKQESVKQESLKQESIAQAALKQAALIAVADLEFALLAS